MSVETGKLPSPISYVHHLVESHLAGSDEESRGKIDELQVLAQNTFQLLASILLADCCRLGQMAGLSTPPAGRSIAMGNMVTYVNESSTKLYPLLRDSFVPELVNLYGASNVQTRTRRERNQRIVEHRNSDSHAASLGDPRRTLETLEPLVDELIGELEFLEKYSMLAVRYFEPLPNRFHGYLVAKQCHGPTHEYHTVKLKTKESASTGEVILASVDRSSWLSLRPWMIFSNGIEEQHQGNDELLLLSQIRGNQLQFQGLLSGYTYRTNDLGWLEFSCFSDELSEGANLDNEDSSVETDKTAEEDPPERLLEPPKWAKRLVSSTAKLVLTQSRSGIWWLMYEGPSNRFVIANVNDNESGGVNLYSIQRASFAGLITNEVYQAILTILGRGSRETVTPEIVEGVSPEKISAIANAIVR